MLKKQTQKIIYNFRLNNDYPLDDKFYVSSLTNLNTELPINERYEGLIFFVKDIKKYYSVKTNTSEVLELKDQILIDQKNGLIINDYSTILIELNNLLPNIANKIGFIVTIFPLNVSFIYDGNTWKYYSGIYYGTIALINSIPTELKNPGSKVFITNNNVYKIFDGNLDLSDEILQISNLSEANQINRYYEFNGEIYYLFSDGTTIIQIENKKILYVSQSIAIGENEFTHNLNSPYIRGYVWINNNITKQLCECDIKFVSNQKSKILSQLSITNCDILIIAN